MSSKHKRVNYVSRIFVLVGLLPAVLLPTASAAQQPAKVPRIGYLSAGSFSSLAGRIEAFRQRLRELGYVEGKNIVIEWREAKGNRDRPPRVGG